jgi:hypothetical protein
MKQLLIIALLLAQLNMSAQTYTSYFTGNATDITVTPQGGTCMMGGATEHDEAMKWFLQRANGGDVLVLRASGSNGYNDLLIPLRPLSLIIRLPQMKLISKIR